MDLYLSISNRTLSLEENALHISGILADILNNLLYIFLMIYKVWGHKNNVKSFHEPIFNHLFFFAGGIVFYRDLARVASALSDNETEGSFYNGLFMLLAAFFFIFNKLLISVTLIFSFLAATQRIVIMYRPKWKFLVTGKCLKYSLIGSWPIAIVFAFMKRCTEPKNPQKSDSVLPVFCRTQEVCDTSQLAIYVIILEVFLFGAVIASNLIYYHFYKLMSDFTDQHQHHRIHLLYQFMPIHTILTVEITIELLGQILIQLNSEWNQLNRLAFTIDGFLTPFIPTVISLSYIASKDNLRALITAVLRPVWEDITG